MRRSLVTADQTGQSDVWFWFRAPSGTHDQMFASLTFTFWSPAGVIAAGMTGLSFVYVCADVSLVLCSDASSLYTLWRPVWLLVSTRRS